MCVTECLGQVLELLFLASFKWSLLLVPLVVASIEYPLLPLLPVVLLVVFTVPAFTFALSLSLSLYF